MKKFLVSLLTVLFTLVLLAAAGAGWFVYRKYSPSKEPADQSAWFGVSGDEVAIVWNQELQESDAAKGRYIDSQVYLPLKWVNACLNDRFYWDAANHQLIYALPDSIVYAGADSVGSTGAPLFVEQGEEVWVLTGLVQTYTDIRTAVFADSDVKRVFIDSGRISEDTAVVKKKEAVRERGGIKSDVLTEVDSGAKVVVLEAMDNWSRVRTADGYLGYVRNKYLEETQTKEVKSTFEAPVYTSISMEEPVCLVWHQVTSKQANSSMEKLMANTKGVNVIAPTWFMLTDNEGSFESLADQDYVNRAHAMGLQVWAVLDNFNKGANVQSEILFADTDARKRLITGLMEEVRSFGLDGINLDIEGIKASAGTHYIQFIRELSVDCRREGIVLSVDTYVPAVYNAFYNWTELGCVTDYVIIMGYDEHYAGGDAGSVASLGYERRGIEDALAMVPREKLVSGIPFYTRLWKEDDSGVTSTAMGITEAKRWVKEHGMELYWQEELGQYYGELEADGGKYLLWMEEETSISRKVDLIRAYDLAGVACWKLGFEPAEIWDIVNLSDSVKIQ